MVDNSLENFFMSVIESFRGRMKEGFPELGIPSLVPSYYNPNFTHEFPIEGHGLLGHAKITSLVILHLEHFKIHELSLDNESKTFKLKIKWPLLRVFFLLLSGKCEEW